VLGKHLGLPRISLGPDGEGKVDKLTVDRLVTHQDRDGSQLPSESMQGGSKSCREEDRLSLTGLPDHRILYHSCLPPSSRAFLTLMCFMILLSLD